MATYKFKTNINCSGCIRTVTPFLNEIDSLDEWRVDTENPDKVLTVCGDDITIDEVVSAVVKAGFKAEQI